MPSNPKQSEVSRPENLPEQENVNEFLNGDETIIRELRDLKEKVDEKVADEQKALARISKQFPEKFSDEAYKKAVMDLMKAGIEVDGLLIKYLTPEKTGDEDYISALKDLQKAGIKVDIYLIGSLTTEKAQAPKFIPALISLHKAGIDVYADLIQYLTPEKAGDKDYLGALKDLQKAGIEVDAGLIKSLTPEKAQAPEFIPALISLHNAGIKVDGWLIKSLTPEKAGDEDYLGVLIALHKAGIKVDSDLIELLTPEKAGDKDYLGVLITFHKAGIKVDSELIYFLTPEKAKAPKFIPALISLHNAGIKVDGWLIDFLTPEKAQAPEFIPALISLHNAGIKVDGWLIKSLTPEKAGDEDYLGVLIALHKTGIEVYARLIDSLTPEKAQDEDYLGTLTSLHNAGIEVDGWLIKSLTPEKAKAPKFIPALISLHNAGIKVDTGLIYYLTTEKAQDEDYLGVLKDLHKAGIKVNGGLIDSLTPEKAGDEDYLGVLKDLQKAGIELDADLIDRLTPSFFPKATTDFTLESLENNVRLLASMLKNKDNLYRFIEAQPFMQVDLKDQASIEAMLPSFVSQLQGIPSGIKYDDYFQGIYRMQNVFGGDFLKNLTLFGDFITGENNELPEKINDFYSKGKRTLAPLKQALNTLAVLGGDEVDKFVKAVDLSIVFKAYQNASVEEKVLVAQAILPYTKDAKDKIVAALHLEKEAVDAFLATESKKSRQKLSNYYYMIKAYDILGDDASKQAVLQHIDFDKIIREKMSLEVFGLLEYLEAPSETWGKIIRSFPMDLLNITAVERARVKLLGISIEMANQIIEEKAKAYIEGVITAENLTQKARFAAMWTNPEQHGLKVGFGNDDKYVFDVYREAAAKMKNALKQYCMDTRCEGMESWGIFDNNELSAIRRAQLALKQAEQTSTPKPAQEAPQAEENYMEQNMQFLRKWITENSNAAEVRGRIETLDDLQKRLTLFDAYESENLEGRMNLIREQVVSFINRNKNNREEILERKFLWKKQQKRFGDILKDLGIEIIDSGATLSVYLQKALTRDFAYTRKKAGIKAAYKARKAKEYLFGTAGNAKVKPGLHFNTGFAGGGESYEGSDVNLDESHAHPSEDFYTIEHDGNTEAIVLKFDPEKGARFDFMVQVGATTKGNKINLAKALRKQHGPRLMFDTVGSMVQGGGMPISMIFENGETKNKKTTMEGDRDGLVIFSPEGKINIVKKGAIAYEEMAQVVDLKSYEKNLHKRVKKMEEELQTLIPAKTKLDPEKLADNNPELVLQYQKLLGLQETYMQWKRGKQLNYASQESYLPQELFWDVAKFGKLSGFLESLYVENGQNMVKRGIGGAHRRFLLKFSDGTYGIYDGRYPMDEKEVAEKMTEINLGGVTVQHAVYLDTGMADDTRMYDNQGKSYQMGYTGQPVGTNRIGIYQSRPD